MQKIKVLFENNRRWARTMKEKDPFFFRRLLRLQHPQFLWIGCSDSRVPADAITGLLPGELFVHRNVGNLVIHTDLNCLSVLQYAVDVLKVKDIIVCGHYGCGAVRAALEGRRFGLVDNWIKHIKDVMKKHKATLGAVKDKKKRLARLCEFNVLEQAHNAAQTTIVQAAWKRGARLTVHAWIYDLSDGLIRELGRRTPVQPASCSDGVLAESGRRRGAGVRASISGESAKGSGAARQSVSF